MRKKTQLLWVVYAMRKDTKEVIDFSAGSRTGNTLKLVTDTVVLSNARKVCTDKLKICFIAAFSNSLYITIWNEFYRAKEPEPENTFKEIKQKNNLFF